MSNSIPTEMISLSLQSAQPVTLTSEWIDINGNGDAGAGEIFVPVDGRLKRVGNEAADGASRAGTIRWIDVNHDGKRQGNETFLFLPGGDLERVTVSGRTPDEWLINDLRRFGPQGDDTIPTGPSQDWWYCPDMHGGLKSVAVKSVGNTRTTTFSFCDGTVSETKEVLNKDGSVARNTTTDWNPDGSVSRTDETKNKDGSTTTTFIHWNPDGSGTMIKETKDKDGNTTRKVTADYDKKGDKIKQTQEEGDKKKEWNKDPKSKAWSNSDDQSAKKPPNEQKGGLPEKLPPKPAKPK